MSTEIKEGDKIIINEETFMWSVFSDIVTFGFLLASQFLNHKYLGDSFLVILVVFIGLLIGVSKYVKTSVKRLTKEEAFEYLKKELKE